MKKKEFNKQVKAGTHKAIELDKWEQAGLLRVDPEKVRIIIHYLIWHIFSNKGLIKLNEALYFFTDLRRVTDGLTKLSEEDLTVYVDYTEEPNDYGKQGLVAMVKFHPVNGFTEI